MGRTILGERGAHCKVQGLSALSYAKTAEPIEMWFGTLSRVDQRNYVFDGVQIPHTNG